MKEEITIVIRIKSITVDTIDLMAKSTNRTRAGMVRQLLMDAVATSAGTPEAPDICMSCHPGNMGCEHCLHGKTDPDTGEIIVCGCRCRKAAAAKASRPRA